MVFNPELNQSQTFNRLLEDTHHILESPKEVSDLCGRRLAFYTTQLEQIIRTTGIRVGIVGEPNTGKTSFSVMVAKLFETFGILTYYIDADLYTHSGDAMMGTIRWEDRTKVFTLSDKEVTVNIQQVERNPGLFFVDFPGKPDDKFQELRLKYIDMALLLGDEPENKRWKTLLKNNGIHFSRLSLKRSKDFDSIVYPIAPLIARKSDRFPLQLYIAATGLLRDFANIKSIELQEPWNFFTQAERVVLEEILDFEYAPLGITQL